MKCAIMQPTYLPWAGYFNLIASVDIFVFLDDVQFEKQSWQNRNRVLVSGQAHYLTVPVRRRSLQQKIYEIEIDDSRNWRDKHTKLLSQIYSKRPYGDALGEIKACIQDREIRMLAELNMKVIRVVSERLELKTILLTASDLGIPGGRSERLAAMAQHLKCDTYVSPPGAREYLERDGIFKDAAMGLEYHTFMQQPYQQGSSSFVSHLSIVDVIANLGWAGAERYVRES